MNRITKVTVTSRRSHPINKDFFTFDMSIEADVSGLGDAEKKAYISKMWDYVNKEVDNQIYDVES